MPRTAASRRIAGLLSVALVALAAGVTPASAEPGTTTRIEVSTGGLSIDNASLPSLSGDGSRVLFHARVTDSLNSRVGIQLVVQDRADGSTDVVCVASDGTWADSSCGDGVISGNGRYVVFRSGATNLVPDEPADRCGEEDDDEDRPPPPCQNVFRHDLETGLTIAVSTPAFGGVNVGDSYSPDISADGSVVAFGSNAPNLVGADGNGDQVCDAPLSECDTNDQSDVFVRDMVAGVTTRVSTPGSGVESDGASLEPSLSADGRWVAFASSSQGFANDPGSSTDIFVHDRTLGTTEGLGYDNRGPVAGESYAPSISADGDRVAFMSQADNLVEGDLNASWNVFAYDRSADTTEILDVRADGSVPELGGADRPDITPDGRLVAFRATADLTGNGGCCLYVRDLDSSTNTLESVNTAGQPMAANGDTGLQDLISDDGRYVAFWVYDSGNSDVYVHDRGPAVGESEAGSGSVTTDSEGDGATVFDPLEATVTSAQPGPITVTETSATQPLPGRYATLGQQVDVTAPAAAPGSPLVLRFVLDGSIVPPSSDLASLAVFRNGVQVGDCVVVSQPDPAPCVESRTRLADRDVEIVVHTLLASAWNVAVELPPTGVDTTPPAVTIDQPADGATYELGSDVTVAFTCSDDVEVATCLGDQPVGSRLDTSQAGLRDFAVEATDVAGNRTTAASTFRVVYPFTGFFSPVDNGAVNLAKAGQTVPVRWRLQNATSTVADPGSFVSLVSRRVACSTMASEPVDVVESYTSSTGLLYQGSGNWQFNWKTPKDYAGQCRTMLLTLSDGSSYASSFEFK